MSPWELLQRHPEYVHVVINHVPIEGLAFGALGLFVSLFLKSREARLCSLLLVLLSAASIYPVYELGDRGYDRLQNVVDDDGEAWLDEHLARAKIAVYVYYGLTALAAAGLALEWRSAAVAPAFSILVLLGSGAALGSGGWVAYAGGKAVHHEFRFEKPPSPGKEAAAHRAADSDLDVDTKP